MALRESYIHRRRPGEESEQREVSNPKRIERRWYFPYNPYGRRPCLRNERLNSNVDRMTKCAIGLNCLTVRMKMSNLRDPGAN